MVSIEVMHSVVNRGASLMSNLPGLMSVLATTPFPLPGMDSMVQKGFSLSLRCGEVLLGAMVK